MAARGLLQWSRRHTNQIFDRAALSSGDFTPSGDCADPEDYPINEGRYPMSIQKAIVADSALVDQSGWAASIETVIRNQFAKRLSNATLEEFFRATAAALRPRIVDALLESRGRFSFCKRQVGLLSFDGVSARPFSSQQPAKSWPL